MRVRRSMGRLEGRIKRARGLDAVAGAEDEGRTAVGVGLDAVQKEREMTLRQKKVEPKDCS